MANLFIVIELDIVVVIKYGDGLIILWVKSDRVFDEGRGVYIDGDGCFLEEVLFRFYFFKVVFFNFVHIGIRNGITIM